MVAAVVNEAGNSHALCQFWLSSAMQVTLICHQWVWVSILS